MDHTELGTNIDDLIPVVVDDFESDLAGGGRVEGRLMVLWRLAQAATSTEQHPATVSTPGLSSCNFNQPLLHYHRG